MADSPNPQPARVMPERQDERNWAPMGIGAAVVAVLVIAIIVIGRLSTGHINPGDPYISKLQISNLHMATADNFAGATVTYIQGTITNNGNKKVTGARLQVTFKNSLGQPGQNDILPLSALIPTSPYVDYGSLDRAPLAPGEKRDFRVTEEHVSADWDGQLPEVKVVAVSTAAK